MSRSFCSHSSDCIVILNLSSFYLPGSSFRDDRAIQTAIQKIKSGSDFFTSECLDLLQKAVDWSISFAAGGMQERLHFPRIFHRERIKNSYGHTAATINRQICGGVVGIPLAAENI